MNDESSSRRSVRRLALALASVLVTVALCPPPASAQVPPRFYWKTLSGANAVPVIVNSVSGNTNPFDPAHLVSPGANLEGTLAIGGYARTFTFLDRAALAAVLLPMGRISGAVAGGVTVAGRTCSERANGFGEPMLDLPINVRGPPAQKSRRAVLR
jgi:hypothetical protein